MSAHLSFHLHSHAGHSSVVAKTSHQTSPSIEIGGDVLGNNGYINLSICNSYAAYALLDAAQACVTWYEDRADRDPNVIA